MPSPIIKAVKEVVQREIKANNTEQRGVVYAVTPSGLAWVKIGGAARSQPCQVPPGLVVNPGDRCKLTANSTSGGLRWIISEIVGKPAFSNGGTGLGQEYTELYPPANVRVVDVIAGAVTITWDSPVGEHLVFEVETGDGDEAGVKILQTSGSYAIIATTTAINVRVRSVAPNGQTSPYSPWVTGDPALSTSSNNSLKVPFTYASSSPITLITTTEGAFLSKVVIKVSTAFNTAATLKIGETGTPESLMLATEIDLQTVGTYETIPLADYSYIIGLIGTLAPAGATQGAGTIILTF